MIRGDDETQGIFVGFPGASMSKQKNNGCVNFEKELQTVCQINNEYIK